MNWNSTEPQFQALFPESRQVTRKPAASQQSQHPSFDFATFISANWPYLALGLAGSAGVAGALCVYLSKPKQKPSKRKRNATALQARSSPPTVVPTSGDSPAAAVVEEPRVPVGLQNIGNSCFLNSLLQALHTSSHFVKYIRQLYSISVEVARLPPLSADDAAERRALLNSLSFVGSLIDLFSRLDSSGSSGSLNPWPFLRTLSQEAAGGKFSHFNQEDVHELYHVLLDVLDKKAARIRRAAQNARESFGIDQTGRPMVKPAADSLEGLLEGIATKKEAAEDESKAPNGGPQVDPSAADTDDSESGSDSPHLQSSASSASLLSALNGDVDSSSGSASSTFATSMLPTYSIFHPDFSFPTDPFEGFLNRYRYCTACNSSRPVIEPEVFTSLTLDFPPGSESSAEGAFSLAQMLKDFLKTVELRDVRCEACNWAEKRKKVTAKLQQIKPAAGKTKLTKKQASFQQLLKQMLQAITHAEMTLQPNAGELLLKKDASAATSTPLALQAAQIADSLLASGACSDNFDFLNSAPSMDDSTPSNGPPRDFLLEVARRSSSPEFLARFPNAAAEFLQGFFELDGRGYAKRTFRQAASLRRLPKTIWFHVNRLQTLYGKAYHHVQFPWRLQKEALSDLQSDRDANQLSWQGEHNRQKMQELVASKISSSTAAPGSSPSSSAGRPVFYELDAIIEHKGSNIGGHYVAYRREVTKRKAAAASTPTGSAQKPAGEYATNVEFGEAEESQGGQFAAGSESLPANGHSPLSSGSENVQWWYCSDSEVARISEEEVLRKPAYLLMYTLQTPSDSSLQSPSNSSESN
jgi:ubiquitin C-terminal hydrolase